MLSNPTIDVYEHVLFLKYCILVLVSHVAPAPTVVARINATSILEMSGAISI